jgi:hydrogenase-4 membrane subunit HyfE
VAVLLSYVMVIMALAISASSTLKQMVRLYQAQAWVLTFVVLLTSIEPDRTQWAITALAVLPATLATVVPPLLGRASLARARVSGPGEPAPEAAGPKAPGGRAASLRNLRDAPIRADLIWLQHGRSRLRGGLSAGIDMMLIATAVLVAYRLVRGVGGMLESEVVPSLAVSMALVLQGLFTMANKRDIIAQIIGLLVIEHGLFLAAVRVAPSALAFLFVLSLFFYVIVTLVILLWILPELHRASRSIEVSDNSRLRG